LLPEPLLAGHHTTCLWLWPSVHTPDTPSGHPLLLFTLW
jgi:hypothetical protein